jgi:hypothetical protein
MWLKLEQRDFLKWLLLRGHVEVSDTDTCGSSGLGPSFGKPNPKGAVSPPACSSARFQEIDSIEIKGARISLNGQPEDFLIIDLKAAAGAVAVYAATLRNHLRRGGCACWQKRLPIPSWLSKNDTARASHWLGSGLRQLARCAANSSEHYSRWGRSRWRCRRNSRVNTFAIRWCGVACRWPPFSSSRTYRRWFCMNKTSTSFSWRRRCVR